MNEKSLKIFELCESLAKLLGDKEAIADLKRLYENHPEMFKDMQEVSQTIKEVVGEPDLIMKNPKSKNKADYIAAKKLNEKDMGDIGIRNDEGTNIIFHTNKKGIRDFKRLQRVKEKLEADGGDALSLHTPSQAWMGANVVSSTLSSTSESIIPQKTTNSLEKEQGQLEKKEVVYKQSMVGTPTSYTQAQSLDERLVDNNISSTAKSIIPQKTTNSLEKEQTQTKHTKDKNYFQNKMQTFKTNKAVKNKDKDFER